MSNVSHSSGTEGDEQEPKLRSELMRALKYGGKISEIRDIVSSGADLNSPGTKPTLMPEVQTYPLMLAVCDRNSEAVQLMLDSGADPNICYEYVREGRDCCLRPLSEAARPDILTMLLDAGAEINAQMRSIHDTETALLRAAHFQPSIGDLLIERGADLNMRDESGRTALYRAINNFNHDLAAHLVQAGAEVDLSPFESKITPLMRAIGSGSPNSLIQSLLQSGADPHLVDASGRTVLHWAAREQNVWAIKWLIAENVDLEAPAPVGVNSGAKSTFHFLFDDCNRAFKRNDSWLSLCLKHLQVIQALAIAGAHLVANSPNNKRAQAQLTEDLNWFIPRSEILSNFPRNRTDKLEAILREIREIVHILTDILGNPLPLKYICRIQIRRSLGRDFRKKLNHLHVPGALQEYLMVYKESDSLL